MFTSTESLEVDSLNDQTLNIEGEKEEDEEEEAEPSAKRAKVGLPRT
jgi:hypothetical protein